MSHEPFRGVYGPESTRLPEDCIVPCTMNVKQPQHGTSQPLLRGVASPIPAASPASQSESARLEKRQLEDSGAVAKSTENCLHQMTTLLAAPRSIPAGSS